MQLRRLGCALALVAAGLSPGCRASEPAAPPSPSASFKPCGGKRTRPASPALPEAHRPLRAAIASAKALFADNRPQAAREVLKEALTADAPVRKDAEALLLELERALGIREGQVKLGGALDISVLSPRVKEAREEARTLLQRGKALYAAREYPNCIETMERVLEIERWTAADVELQGFADQARAYIAQAKKLQPAEAQRRLRNRRR